MGSSSNDAASGGVPGRVSARVAGRRHEHGRGGGIAVDDARTRAQLARLELTVLRRIDGVLLGDYQGLIPGPGSEPGDSREYQVGDDVRLMDWSVTARTSVPHVRQPIADRELETWLVVDLSPSVDAGSHVAPDGTVVTKRDLALAATATYGFLASAAGNRVGLLVLGAGDEPVIVPPAGGRRHVRALLERVATAHADTGTRPRDGDEDDDDTNAAEHGDPRAGGDPGTTAGSDDGSPDPGGTRRRLRSLARLGRSAWARIRPHHVDTDAAHAGPSALARGTTALRGLARRRGLVVVISDFLGETDWERPLRVVSNRQQVVGVRLTDPLDVALPAVGRVALRDAASGEILEVDVTREQARRYAHAARLHRTAVVTALRHCGAPVLSLRTDREWVRDVIAFAGLRRKGAFPDGERALADLDAAGVGA